MSWLLDTHVFIWFESRSDRLPGDVRHMLSTTDDPVFVSVVSLWEISIKRRLGKLDFVGSPRGVARATQCLVYDLTLVSADAAFRSVPDLSLYWRA